MVAANTESQTESLIAEGRPYALRIVAVFCSRFRALDRDAIESDAMYGLFRAALNFNPARHRRFPAFARKRIVGEILDGIQRESKQQLILGDVQAFGGERRQGNHFDPATTAAIRDEADFVRKNLSAHAHAHSGARRLSATLIARDAGITLGAASRRIRLAKQLIEGSVTCAN